jgi:DNA-binding NarL/FixJ family response regulator
MKADMSINARPIPTRDYSARRRLVKFSPHGEALTISAPAVSPPVAPTAKPVRVLIAGDHATLRACLKTMLELDPDITVVGEASDDCELVKMAYRVQPDVVLLDLDMRCCDNYEAVAEITERNLTSSVVALTIHDDEIERAHAEKAGVKLFLEKGVPYRQLISAVRSEAKR